MPVVFIGTATLAVFLVLIIVAQFIPINKPQLVKLSASEIEIQDQESIPPTVEGEISDLNQRPRNTRVKGVTHTVENGVIEYTEEGFNPKEATVKLGQKVSWINKTGRTIYLKQLLGSYGEFREPIEIAPGGVFNFEVYQLKLWTYEEKVTKNFGSLFVTP